MGRITVLGAGSWGTTLAQVLAHKGKDVSLWAREEEVRASIAERRENSMYLPGVELSSGIAPFTSIEEALDGSDCIVSVIPSHGLRGVFSGARGFIRDGALVVSATKGIEEGSMMPPSGVISEALSGKAFSFAVLSGPSFAKEVSRALPAALTAASASVESARRVQDEFSTNYFRVYTNDDVTGVELGGALKNVVAVASGISDGLGLGHNARAALITRGLAEMARLGVKMGARKETFSGLSGLGDLVLTCTGPLSRNYSVGVSIGKGEAIGDITGRMLEVAEGVKTSRATRELALRNGVEMPIAEAVYSVIYEGKQPREAVLELMGRDLKGE